MEGQMTIYGYARVSSKEQTLDAQHEALRAAGCRKVFAEKQSGMKTDRAELAKAIAKLRADDVLIVTKIDRLARSTRDLLNVIHEDHRQGGGHQIARRPADRHHHRARPADVGHPGHDLAVRA
jgi:DNA invertase Pin-like site-specific DNA recombinase